MNSMAYVKESEQLLKEIFFEDWMDKEDWKDMLESVKEVSGITLESLSKDIEIGINNGYSLEQQLTIFRNMFK